MGSFDKSQSCSLPQSTTKKKCLVFVSSQSVFIVNIVAPLCHAHSQFHSKLVSAASRFASISLSQRGGEGRSSSGEESGGRRRKSHQQCLRCGILEASCYPGLLQPHLPSRLDGGSRLRESRSGDGDLCCRRGGGWLCQSPVFSS